jgi:hypothetical protein
VAGRVVAGLLVGGVVVVGCAPALSWIGLVHPLGKREVTTEWQVVSIAADRRSTVIRVGACAEQYSGTDVSRVGRNVRLTVFRRKEYVAHPQTLDCVAFWMMPTQTVDFGFTLPADGHVIDSGCAAAVCARPVQPAASAP